MRHKKAGRRLGRETAHREAMKRNLLMSLVEHERITTTVTRAKELRILAEKIITLAKKNTPAAFTQLSKYIRARRKELITKLVREIAPRFADRNGGYTRIVKLGFRHGDGAPTAIIEYLPEDKKVVEKKEEKAEK